MPNTFWVPDWLLEETRAAFRRRLADALEFERRVFGRVLTDEQRAFYAEHYGSPISDDELNDDE